MPTAISNKFLRDKLCNVVVNTTHLPLSRVVWETWNDRRPEPGSYISLYQISRQFHQSNIPVYTSTGGVYAEVLLNSVEDVVRINAHGPDAFDLLTRIASQLSSGDRWFDLWEYIGHGRIGSIEFSDYTWQGKTQQRCHMDLTYYTCLIGSTVRPDGSEEYPWIEKTRTDVIFYSLDNKVTTTQIMTEAPRGSTP